MINFTYEYRNKLVFGDLAIGEWFQDPGTQDVFKKISDAYALPLRIFTYTFPEKHCANLDIKLNLFLGESAVTRCDIDVNIKECDDQTPAYKDEED